MALIHGYEERKREESEEKVVNEKKTKERGGGGVVTCSEGKVTELVARSPRFDGNQFGSLVCYYGKVVAADGEVDSVFSCP